MNVSDKLLKLSKKRLSQKLAITLDEMFKSNCTVLLIVMLAVSSNKSSVDLRDFTIVNGMLIFNWSILRALL